MQVEVLRVQEPKSLQKGKQGNVRAREGMTPSGHEREGPIPLARGGAVAPRPTAPSEDKKGGALCAPGPSIESSTEAPLVIDRKAAVSDGSIADHCMIDLSIE